MENVDEEDASAPPIPSLPFQMDELMDRIKTDLMPGMVSQLQTTFDLRPRHDEDWNAPAPSAPEGTDSGAIGSGWQG